MDACTGDSAIRLLGLASSFLLAVLWLDMFWVRIPQALQHGDFPGALRKRGWVNVFVAAGAAGAAVLLLLWIHSCTHA
jgi:hypothetical protein